MRLAYLCNLYPAVSHSFVRREIESVERAGNEVFPFSIRPPRGDLRDEGDLREARRTETVLGGGIAQLVPAACALLLSHPVRSARAFGAAWSLSAPGLKSKALHCIYWLEAAWLLRRLQKIGVDHLHAHFGTNPAALAAIVRAWGGPPFSFTVHGPDEFDAPVTLSLRAKIDAARFVAAISSYGRSQLMRWSPPEQWDKIKVVRCGLGVDFLHAVPVPVPPDSNEFVCVARLSAQKGLPLLIAACDTLRKRGERFTVTIIGDGELRGRIQAEIHDRALEDVISLAGVQTAAEIRDHLVRARTFVLPSFAEGLPVVLMEALALGRPVITTAVAGIPELVDEQCGWLIPAGSEDALVQAMTEALHAPAGLLTEKGKAGRERVLRLHDSDANARLLIDAVRGIAPSSETEQLPVQLEASTAA